MYFNNQSPEEMEVDDINKPDDSPRDLNSHGNDNPDEVDDDVLFVGTSITVKMEKGCENYKDKDNDDDDNGLNKVEDEDNRDILMNDPEGNNEPEKNNKSGFLLSRLRNTSKAYYIKDLSKIKRESKKNNFTSGLNSYYNDLSNESEYSRLENVRNPGTNNSQSSTISNNTNYSYRKGSRGKTTLREYVNYPYYENYNPYYNGYNTGYNNMCNGCGMAGHSGSHHNLRNYCPNEQEFGYYNDDVDREEPGKYRKLLRYLTPTNFNNWMRTIFNVVITFVLLYILIIVVIIIKNDIKARIKQNIISINSRAVVCYNEYRKNKCSTLSIPAMEAKCKEWEECMNKENLVSEDISSISVELVGSLINKFLNQLDIKSIIFLFLVVLLMALLVRGNSNRHVVWPYGVGYAPIPGPFNHPSSSYRAIFNRFRNSGLKSMISRYKRGQDDKTVPKKLGKFMAPNLDGLSYPYYQ